MLSLFRLVELRTQLISVPRKEAQRLFEGGFKLYYTQGREEGKSRQLGVESSPNMQRGGSEAGREGGAVSQSVGVGL